jgi:hypothetical protein
VIELLPGVNLKLGGDVHVLGAGEHLGINDIGDDRLVFASEVFVQKLREAVARDVGFAGGGLEIGHSSPSFIGLLWLGWRILGEFFQWRCIGSLF